MGSGRGMEQSPERAGGCTGLGWLWGEEAGELLAWQLFLFERRNLKALSRLQGQKAVSTCALLPCLCPLSLLAGTRPPRLWASEASSQVPSLILPSWGLLALQTQPPDSLGEGLVGQGDRRSRGKQSA